MTRSRVLSQRNQPVRRAGRILKPVPPPRVTHAKHDADTGEIIWQANFPIAYQPNKFTQYSLHRLVPSTDGGVYVARHVGDGGPATIDTDVLIKRFSSTGADEKTITPPLTANLHSGIIDLGCDSSNNVNIAVWGSDGTNTLFQYDADNNEQWKIDAGVILEMITDHVDEICNVLRYSTTIPYPGVLSRYDSSGNHQWDISNPGSFLYNANGMVYCISKPLATEVRLTEVDSSGNVTHHTISELKTPADLAVTASDWIFTTTAGDMYSYDLASDAQNWAYNPVGAEPRYGAIDVDSSDNIYAMDANPVAFLSKLDSSGVEQWRVRTIRQSGGFGEMVVAASDVFVCGLLQTRL